MNETRPQSQARAEDSGAKPGHELESLIDRLKEAGDESVSVDDILKVFEHRSMAALVSIIALTTLLPVIGGIPGVTLVTATLILLIIGESLLSSHGGIWVPRFIGRRKISKDRVEKGVEKARPYVRKVDRWIRPRLESLTRGRTQRTVLLSMIIVLTLTFYPLNFVPYAVTAPALGVLAFGLALLAADGYLALVGYAMAVATIGTGIAVLTGGGGGGTQG